ncbi:hypothetical protein X907_1339 [Glycocaulis alkaliphilus]|uniref:Uncharacterized protein n=1 Tax=Glycocaulis alkaliphilus TaxID=1434191 RepID=A0A3T0E9D0_9PROT|nr:DUF2459 domain-containing protein [Glycocaulis alkaliphilus]AZU03872.1 hypothetical protein X907_1339 [Glycocaulis alkaliphilus]GGB85691.1 hypothetical protein GCM10007417_27160 [Glycocaulis alkaliphilus]
MARLYPLICLLTGFTLALAACTRPAPVAVASADDCELIAVSSNGWHTNFYLPASAFPGDGPLRAAFPDARWFSIGWGDAGAYVDGVNPLNSIAAIAWPTRSVVHVAALGRDPREAYLSEYRDVALSGEALAIIVEGLEAELVLDEAGAPRLVADGLDARGSAFLAGRSTYHAFQSCNVWTAARLREAGLDVGWTGAHLLPASLLNRLERTAPSRCPPPGKETR